MATVSIALPAASCLLFLKDGPPWDGPVAPVAFAIAAYGRAADCWMRLPSWHPRRRTALCLPRVVGPGRGRL
jgi:hypothetical protein